MQKVHVLQAVAPAAVAGKFLRFDGGWDTCVDITTTWFIPVMNADGVYFFPDGMAQTVCQTGISVASVVAFLPSVTGNATDTNTTTATTTAPPPPPADEDDETI